MSTRHADRPRARKRSISPKNLVALALTFVMLVTIGGASGAALALPLVLAKNGVVESTLSALTEVPFELERRELAQASSVYWADGTLMSTFFAQNRVVVPLEEISDHMINAVIAIEDERFFEHNGVDARAIIRAATNNLQGGNLQGASTITQQYVKNRLIDVAYHDGDPFGVITARNSTLARKAREAALAIELEQVLTKYEILEGYLNLAQFGRNNIFGVEQAAQFFFSKPASDLTPVEAATIAGITNAPSRFDPLANPEASQHRRNLVLFNMYRLGFIDTDEWESARTTPIQETLRVSPVQHGCQAAGDAAFFCDFVISVIRTSPEFGATEAERLDLLNRGGLRIMTTLDPAIQAAAAEQVNRHVPGQNTADLDAAIVSVENGTGHILAMAQNAIFDARPTPVPGGTAINFAAGPDTGSLGFQPGSTLKPFIMAEWLRQPHNNLNTRIDAQSIRPISQNNWSAHCTPGFHGGAAWWPNNAVGQRFGSVTPFTAMYHSINTAFARMSLDMDLCNLRDTMWMAGFRPSASSGMMPLHSPQPHDIELNGPAMILGDQNTTPLALAAAYATFATGGVYCSPVAITQVLDRFGEPMAIPSANCIDNALRWDIADQVSYTLQRSMDAGTGRVARLSGGREAGGKTGTTNFNSHTWFVGYTAQMSTAAWVGNHQANAVHQNINFNGRFIRMLFGSTLAAPMWRDFMNQAHEGQPNIELFRPDMGFINWETDAEYHLTSQANPVAPPAYAPPAYAPPAYEPPADTGYYG